MTLLSICSEIAPKLSIDAPSSIVGNDAVDAKLLLQLAQEEGYSLARRYFWNKLRREHTFTTLAAASQGASSIPDDFDCIVPETIFNRTQRREVYGPITPQEWQQLQATLITAVNPSYILRGGEIYLSPTPSAGETIAYEYMSDCWAQSSGGTLQNSFLADTDTILFPEEVFKQGLIWRFRAHKSYEHETDRLKYERYVTDLAIRDGCKPRLNTGIVSGSTVSRIGKARMNDFNTITP